MSIYTETLQVARMREREKVTRRSLTKDIGEKRRKQKTLATEGQKDNETTVIVQESMLLESYYDGNTLELCSCAVQLKEPLLETQFYKKQEKIENTLLAENILHQSFRESHQGLINILTDLDIKNVIPSLRNRK